MTIEELRELRDGVTKGSWHAREQPGFSEDAFGGVVFYPVKNGTQFGIAASTVYATKQDVELITAAPTILSELIELRERVEQVKDYCHEADNFKLDKESFEMSPEDHANNKLRTAAETILSILEGESTGEKK